MASKTHHLPLFPPGVTAAFRSLCQVAPSGELLELRQLIHSSYESFLRAAHDKPLLDVSGAKQINEICNYLLDIYDEHSDHNKSLIIGAIRYCVIDQDIFDDTVYVTGLFDDKKVVNYVLEEIGVNDKYIHIFG